MSINPLQHLCKRESNLYEKYVQCEYILLTLSLHIFIQKFIIPLGSLFECVDEVATTLHGIILAKGIVHHATIECQCHIAATHLDVYPLLALTQCIEIVLRALKLVHLEVTLRIWELHHPLSRVTLHAALYKADVLG